MEGLAVQECQEGSGHLQERVLLRALRGIGKHNLWRGSLLPLGREAALLFV